MVVGLQVLGSYIAQSRVFRRMKNLTVAVAQMRRYLLFVARARPARSVAEQTLEDLPGDVRENCLF